MATESILNRKALRDFHIIERYEAGIELKGSEVKSIRSGKANISDAFARIENGEAFLYNADIQPYERASHEIPAAKRVRKLLLHRQRSISFTAPPTSLDMRSLYSVFTGRTGGSKPRSESGRGKWRVTNAPI